MCIRDSLQPAHGGVRQRTEVAVDDQPAEQRLDRLDVLAVVAQVGSDDEPRPIELPGSRADVGLSLIHI